MRASSLAFTDEFEAALAILRAGGNLFLTGKAGTGQVDFDPTLHVDDGSQRG